MRSEAIARVSYHAAPGSSARLRHEEPLAGHDRRAAQPVRLLELPDALARVTAVARRRDRPQRLPRLRRGARCGVGPAPVSRASTAQTRTATSTTMTMRPNMCSHYDTNTCSLSSERVSAGAAPAERRSCAACGSPRRRTAPSPRLAASRRPAARSDDVQSAQPWHGRPIGSADARLQPRPPTRTHTFARASSPAATRVVTSAIWPPTATFAPSTSTPGDQTRATARARRRGDRACTAAADGRAVPSARAARPGSRCAARRRGTRRSSATRRPGRRPPRG